jgi:cell division protein FtsL
MVATTSRATTASAVPVRERPAPRPKARPAPARPDLRVVGAQRRRLGAIGVIGVLFVFGLLFGLVVFQTMLVQSQQHLDKVQQQIRDAQAQYQSQRLKVAQLESPARIVEEATTRLGMVTPPGTTYLTPSPETAAEVGVAPETAADAATDASAGDDWPDVKPYLSEQG